MCGFEQISILILAKDTSAQHDSRGHCVASAAAAGSSVLVCLHTRNQVRHAHTRRNKQQQHDRVRSFVASIGEPFRES